ncbi:MAG: D-alanine--D-alanine ligase [Chloroflexi bacterium]|nr:D-alanine--D-alanine ligase [Chloroflexota bacterium]
MTEKKRKLKVGVIFGGRSAEHEVSLVSAEGITRALDPERFEVIPIGITRNGQWLAAGNPLQSLSAGQAEGATSVTLLSDRERPGLLQVVSNADSQSLQAVRITDLDVIFPVLHGPYGEDGTIQGLLELANIPYVGSGVLASASGMDKIAMKYIFQAHGLPVLPFVAVGRGRWESTPDTILERLEAALGYPMFVKPANMGSSIGISKARNRETLKMALDQAARYDRKLVVEKGIEVREIEVSVLGNDDPIASVPGEVVPSNEFYDYAAKYLDNASGLLIPAPLSAAQRDEVRRLALRAFLALDCAGMARCDFLMDKHSGVFWLNEINTIPGFTPISMYPKLWEASGISYPELVERLIDLALERHAEKQRIEVTR